MKISKSKSFFVLLLISSAAYPLPPHTSEIDSQSIRILDTDTWIDANRVLMFVTNKGSFAFDQGGMLGKFDGFYYPYIGIENIQNGTARNSVIFAAGIWIGGIDSASGDTLISVAEYSDDYFPGPMVNGTYIPNANMLPQYRVYKIYADSQASNPNQDYLNWPVGQGAPVDGAGDPKLFGDQTLWSVYNDANANPHINNASSNMGLGVEIQNTVWASMQDGGDSIPVLSQIPVVQVGNTRIEVVVYVVNPYLLTGHNYAVYTGNDLLLGPVWHLYNMTTGDTLLTNQTTMTNNNNIVTDGFLIHVSQLGGEFRSFEVVANAGGPLNPPDGGAFEFQGFPSAPLSDNQQVGPARWAFHTGDNGSSSGGGTRGSYAAFLARVVRNDNGTRISGNDFEMRFTGSYSNPGVNGSHAIRAFQDDQVFWVPFELWRIGNNTPETTSDDIRLTTVIFDMGEDFTYNLENWGTQSGAGSGSFEHSGSGADNDPYTDWVYWYMSTDTSAGESGYLADLASMNNGTFVIGDQEIMARTVLINWNGGEQPPFNQDLPEQGTVFRISSQDLGLPDTFLFSATPPPFVTTGPEGVSVYSKYKLINKSSNTYSGFFVSLWFDPDIGDAGDDFVGCDTINDIFYSYNDGPDLTYGAMAPAVGGRLLEGLAVPSLGDTALVDGVPLPDYKNLGMYSFSNYINGTDPQSPMWTYQYMKGLNAAVGGFPWPNGSRYAVPGDPVNGNGDLDVNSSDRRMMATFGPIDLRPNDTQQIVFKLAVGQGVNQMASITELKEVLINVPSGSVEPISFVRPEPQRSVFVRSIEPFYDSIFVGWADGRSVLNIAGADLVINDSLTPQSASLILSHPIHSGSSWKLLVDARRFLLPYGIAYDTTQKQFSVEGQLTDGSPFSVSGTFAYIGHRRGDINNNDRFDVVDLNYLINYIFRSGPAPLPLESGDTNYDSRISILDINTLVAYIFRSG